MNSRAVAMNARAILMLALLPLLGLGALGSAEPVVYQPTERSQTPTTVGAGGGYEGMRPVSADLPAPLPGQLGVAVADLSGPDQQYYQRTTGAVIERVAADSPASRAGLLRNDVILAVDDKPVARAADVVAMLQGTAVGQNRTLRILRDRKEQLVRVTF